MFQFLGFLLGRKGGLDGSDGVRRPETNETRVVVCAPAAVEGGEIDLFCDGAEGCWECCGAR